MASVAPHVFSDLPFFPEPFDSACLSIVRLMGGAGLPFFPTATCEDKGWAAANALTKHHKQLCIGKFKLFMCDSGISWWSEWLGLEQSLASSSQPLLLGPTRWHMGQCCLLVLRQLGSGSDHCKALIGDVSTIGSHSMKRN